MKPQRWDKGRSQNKIKQTRASTTTRDLVEEWGKA
jgi:hypothetical protein